MSSSLEETTDEKRKLRQKVNEMRVLWVEDVSSYQSSVRLGANNPHGRRFHYTNSYIWYSNIHAIQYSNTLSIFNAFSLRFGNKLPNQLTNIPLEKTKTP
uniref:Uncharacterized protein n=1 Tax=Lygus hesperus TaxID=30085 RepID=A0A146LGB4_LYGHE